MRRVLATTGLAGALALTGLSAGTATAQDAPAGTTWMAQNVDVDEPASRDGDDDSGKYGLIGLSGMLGLFGYRHYKNRAAGRSGPIGGIDTDGSGSRRI